jgi:hypothetical protein
MTITKKEIRSRLTEDADYLSLLGSPSELPYKTFYVYPPEIPDFPFVVFSLRPGVVNTDRDETIIDKRIDLTVNVWAYDSAYESIADRIIYLLQQYGNENGFRVVYDRSNELYDEETNAYGINLGFNVFYRQEMGVMALNLDHGDLQGLGDDDHTQYLPLDGTRDILQGDLKIQGDLYVDSIRELTASANIDIYNHLFPGASGLDFGDSSNFFRTLYLSNDGGNVVFCQAVQSGGGPTDYTFNCGGGQFGAEQNQGGTFTFKMNDIASSLGTCVNQIIFDPGRPDIFQQGTTNDVIFQADNGIAVYGFVSSFGGFNDVEYGLELRRISGTESFAKTLIFDNQIPESDFRRSIDFRINSVNKLTIENDGTVNVIDKITTPELTATVINNGFNIGTVAAPGVNVIAFANFFNLNWFDYLTINAVTTNLPVCLGMFPNGTGTQSFVNVYNSSSTGAAAWLSLGVRGAIAELVVRDFAQTTNITDLNIGSGGNDFPFFDVTCTTLTDINLVFAGVTEYNFTPTAFTLADANNISFGTTTGTKIGTATNQKIGFFNKTPVTQRLKANYNNWAALSDVVNALVDLGLFDQA